MVYIGHYPNIPFDIPRNWIWVELGKIGRWQSGSTPNRLNKAYYGGNIPWLKTGDLNDGYITHIPEYITEKALNETSVKLNPIGSVLIAMYGATLPVMYSKESRKNIFSIFYFLTRKNL